MQLTNETALPVAWIEAEDDNWGCDEEDCEEGEVGIFHIGAAFNPLGSWSMSY